MRKYFDAMLVVAALGMAACGRKSGAPAAPSSGNGATSLTAATITGTVRNAVAGGSINVSGTGMTSGLDGAGHFTLANVPTGDLRLQVNSGGMSAMVPIAAVQAAQTIEIVVNVSGASANLESEVRHGTGETELKGVVDAVPPATAASAFTVAGKTVTTNASTTFVNGSFAGLKVGTRVEVKGTLAGDSLAATRVEIEDAPAPIPPPTPPPPTPKPEPTEAEFTGTISALSGSASSFQFTAAGRLVKGDATTALLGSSDRARAFADLANGSVVEVKGVQLTGFVQASRIRIEGPDADDGDDDGQDEAEAEGTLGAISGTCPVIASSAGATKFTTSASTRFDGAACAAFKAGDRVEVKGTRKTDGSIAAARLEEKK
jgi:hypothetical protein